MHCQEGISYSLLRRLKYLVLSMWRGCRIQMQISRISVRNAPTMFTNCSTQKTVSYSREPGYAFQRVDLESFWFKSPMVEPWPDILTYRRLVQCSTIIIIAEDVQGCWALYQKVLKHSIIIANKHHTNKHRKDAHFQPGDLVWIHLRKERFPSKCKSNLMPRLDGPSKILEKIGPNAYKVDLPSEYGVSTTFNVADLSHYDEDNELPSSRSNSNQAKGVMGTILRNLLKTIQQANKSCQAPRK